MTPSHTRRGFLASTAGAALALAACGPSGTQTSGKIPTDTSGLVTYHIGNIAEPQSLDPNHGEGSEWEAAIVGDLMMGLTTEAANGDPLPGAAESWETSSDGKTWTFHLRDHLWSDGIKVTAEDFLYSWRRVLNPKTASALAVYLFVIENGEAVANGKMPETALGVSAPDDKTLVVRLAHPAPYLTQLLMHQSLYPVPRHLVEAKGDVWSKPGTYVGNGAFTLTEWTPNDHITLVKNFKFYDAANVRVDRAIFYPTADYEAVLKRFRAGEFDSSTRFPVAEMDWIRTNIPETLHVTPILLTEFIAINDARKPFGDVRVRQALNLGIDRQTLLNKIDKVGDVPAYGFVPPGIANYPGNVTFDFKSLPYADCVKQGQSLMQQAGFGPTRPLKTTFFIRSSSVESLRVPAAMQAMLRAVYIEIDLVQNDTSIFYSKVQQGEYDLAEVAWGADFNDAVTFLDLMRKGNVNHFSNYNNPKYDALLDRTTTESDSIARGQTLAQAEAMLLKDYVMAPLFFWVSHDLVRPYVKGWQDTPQDFHRTRWISIDEKARAATALR